MATIDQHCQLDFLRTSQVHKPIHRRSYRPSGEQNVVDEYDDFIRHVERHGRFSKNRLIFAQRQIIAIQCDIQFTDWNLDALDTVDTLHESMGEMHATCPYS